MPNRHSPEKQTAHSKKYAAKNNLKPLGNLEATYHNKLVDIAIAEGLIVNTIPSKLAAIRFLVDRYFTEE